MPVYQAGASSLIFCILTLLVLLPGGWIADLFSTRVLLVISGLATAVLGFWYSFFPAFPWLALIHALFAFTTVFFFCAAAVKAVNNLGTAREQGQLFGIYAMSRIVISLAGAGVADAVFEQFPSSQRLRAVILFYSVAQALASLLAFTLLRETPKPAGADDGDTSFADLLSVFRNTKLWLYALGVFCGCAAVSSLQYIDTYHPDLFGIDADITAVIRTATVCAIVAAAVLSGFLADRAVSKPKLYIFLFTGMILFSVPVLPLTAYISIPLLSGGLLALFALFAFSFQALHFAAFDDVGIPKHLVGSAAGLLFLVGYLPAVFLNTLDTLLLSGDSAENTLPGYPLVICLMIASSAIGLSFSIALHHFVKRDRAADRADQTAK